MQDEKEAQIRKDIAIEIEVLEIRYQTIKAYLAGMEMENFEVLNALRAYKDDLSIITAHVLTLYELKGQRAKITWDSLFTNLETAIDTIRNSTNPKPRAAIETALNMSEPKVESVMDFFATLKRSL